jgi:hypothetical protein
VAVLGAVAAAVGGGVAPEADPVGFLAGVHAAYLLAGTALVAAAVAAALFLRPGRDGPGVGDAALSAEAAPGGPA